MKVAISIPDPVFNAADRIAKRLGISRSELYAKALAFYLERQRQEGVTDTLDRVYADADDSQLPEDLRVLQELSVRGERW